MARRAKAEDWRKQPRSRSGGSIYEDKSGRVYARLQFTGANGERKDKKVLATSRTDARRLLAKLREELHHGGSTALDSSKLTFNDLAKIYQTKKLVKAEYRNGRKVAGLRSLSYLMTILPVLVQAFGRRHLRSIKHSDLETFRLERLNAPLRTYAGKDGKGKPVYRKRAGERAMSSVHRELELARAMFRYAQREGWITKSPFETTTGLISKASETKRERILSIQEESGLLAACVGRREHLRPILIAALDLGCRRGELFKVTWEDVDLAAGLLQLKATNTKTQTARTLGITDRLRVELERLRTVQPPSYDGPIFGVVDNVKTAWTSVRREAGLLDVRFHDLRHSAISRMVQAGIPVASVMKLSGHTGWSSFSRYVNTDSEGARHGAEMLNEMLNAHLARTPPLQATEELVN